MCKKYLLLPLILILILGLFACGKGAVLEEEKVAAPSRIAFVSDRDGDSEIYVMDADGTGQRNLTNNPSWDGNPSWSPNGDKITFYSERDGNYEIYVMNVDGTGQTRLTNNLY